MAEFYDGYDRFASDYQDPKSAFDCAKMKALFGWTPTYSWRDQCPATPPCGRRTCSGVCRIQYLRQPGASLSPNRPVRRASDARSVSHGLAPHSGLPGSPGNVR